jgi:glycosyltransferase involved in cell wall biosynthesis
VVGKKEGWLTEDRTAINAAGADARIQLLGKISKELLQRYVAHAEALVFPSLYEGFGLPPLEAMASGCPVVVSRAASIPEVCGDAAVYVDPSDVTSIIQGIERILNDSALREALRCRGIERARHFTWENTVTSTLTVLDRVLS